MHIYYGLLLAESWFREALAGGGLLNVGNAHREAYAVFDGSYLMGENISLTQAIMVFLE